MQVQVDRIKANVPTRQILDIGDDDVDFKYVITLYCKNKKGQDIVCHVNGFKPFFYVRVPDEDGDLSSLKSLFNNALQDQMEKEVRKLPDFRTLKDDELTDNKEFKKKVDNKMEYYTNPDCKRGYCGMSYYDKVIK